MQRKSSEERKNEIVESAYELIMREGVQALTIKNISMKNGITEAAIYRHFKDKHAILMALIENFEHNLMEALDHPIRNHKNPIHRLKEVMKAHTLFTEERKGIFFAITAESIHFNDDSLRRKILEVIENYKIRIKTLFKEAKQEGLLREDINLDTASLMFFGMIQAAIVHFALTNYTVPQVTKFNGFWRIFLKGIEKNNQLE